MGPVSVDIRPDGHGRGCDFLSMGTPARDPWVRYPWISDPMGMDVGVIFYPWARPPETRRRYGQ